MLSIGALFMKHLGQQQMWRADAVMMMAALAVMAACSATWCGRPGATMRPAHQMRWPDKCRQKGSSMM